MRNALTADARCGPAEAWTAALDELERLLDAQAQCLGAARDGVGLGAVPPPFSVPDHLPPMPDAVRQRATDLKVRNDELAARARQIEQSIQLSQQAAPRRGVAVRHARASFDEKF